jgi:hypothetical protein
MPGGIVSEDKEITAEVPLTDEQVRVIRETGSVPSDALADLNREFAAAQYRNWHERGLISTQRLNALLGLPPK